MKPPASVADAIILGAEPSSPMPEESSLNEVPSEDTTAEDAATEELMNALDTRDVGAFREALRSLIDIMRE